VIRIFVGVVGRVRERVFLVGGERFEVERDFFVRFGIVSPDKSERFVGVFEEFLFEVWIFEVVRVGFVREGVVVREGVI
jgi:hypothetical protein